MQLLNRAIYWIALWFYIGQSFLDMANRRKWIHLEKTNPVISYTLVGPDLNIFLELILKLLLIITSVLVVLVRHVNGAGNY